MLGIPRFLCCSRMFDTIANSLFLPMVSGALMNAVSGTASAAFLVVFAVVLT